MSDPNASSIPSSALESGIYAKERAQQETSGVTDSTHATGGASYIDQAKGAASSAAQSVTNTAQNLSASAQQTGSNLANQASATGERTGPSTQENPHGTYVDQARGLAASTLSTAQPYVDAAVQKAQTLAGAAQAKGNEAAAQTERATSDLEAQASAKTNAAVAEGQHDTAHATGHVQSQGSKYVDQAIALAGAALGAAQGILHAGQEKLGVGAGAGTARDGTAAPSHGVVGTIQSTAAAVLDTTSHYVASAQAGLQPHVATVKDAAQPHVDTVKQTAQPYVASAQSTLASAQSAAQPHIDAAVNVARPHVEYVQGVAQPHVDTIKSATGPYVASAQQTLASVTSPIIGAGTATGNASAATTTATTEVTLKDTKPTDAGKVQPHVDASAPTVQSHDPTTNTLPSVDSTKSTLAEIESRDPHTGATHDPETAKIDSTIHKAEEIAPQLDANAPAARDQAHIDDAKKSLGI